jgi:hypothetical protein
MTARRPRRTPSWLGTLVVIVAVLVMGWRAAAELRRATTPRDAPDADRSP